jgi:3-dehydroquinate synthase II/3-amino-4-hydroxybenzoic acid synthase
VLVAVFVDETNIPLEPLLARAQGTRTRVLKELLNSVETTSGIGVLESGPAGLAVRGDQLANLDRVAEIMRTRRDERKELVPLEVIRAERIGMGYRECIDTTTLFGEDEGMIVGSTSSGGFLVCAEVHYPLGGSWPTITRSRPARPAPKCVMRFLADQDTAC